MTVGLVSKEPDSLVDMELGRLKEVCVRAVWKHEARDFTRWLANNLDRLSEVLDIELELEEREKYVGANRADIVARVFSKGTQVLIENQLERSDLRHLGQILAYLAGLEAHIVIWIAPSFRDAHLSAIRWLNQNTSEPFAFFAVSVKAFQIGCSPYAPCFRVLESPAEWDQMAKNIQESVELHKFYRDFWAHCAAKWPKTLGLTKGYARGRFRRWIRESDLKVALYVLEDRVRVYVTGNRDEPDDVVFSRIQPFRPLLIDSLRDSSFLPGDNPRCTTEFFADTRDRNNWDALADWLDRQRKKYESVLREEGETLV